MPRTPRSTLFPYTTLFRSWVDGRRHANHDASPSVIVDNLNLLSSVPPTKCNPPLVVDPNRILAYPRSEEHTSELQSRLHLVCRLLLEKKKDQPDFTEHFAA